MLQATIEGAARQAERAGGVAGVGVAVERALNEHALGLLEREPVERGRALPIAGEVQVGGVQLVTAGEQDGALDDVLQLAHVARPGMLEERADGVGPEERAASV